MKGDPACPVRAAEIGAPGAPSRSGVSGDAGSRSVIDRLQRLPGDSVRRVRGHRRDFFEIQNLTFSTLSEGSSVGVIPRTSDGLNGTKRVL